VGTCPHFKVDVRKTTARVTANDKAGLMTEAAKKSSQGHHLVIAVATAKDKKGSSSVLHSLLLCRVASVSDAVANKAIDPRNLTSEVMASYITNQVDREVAHNRVASITPNNLAHDFKSARGPREARRQILAMNPEMIRRGVVEEFKEIFIATCRGMSCLLSSIEYSFPVGVLPQ
jgi:hypothetical protein